ncbi:MAG: HD domain-containing protein [Deltaproteobacteria bacterium]|nr:HD domain-containing protein [Deltaproteobacteria bacterium]
MARALLERQGGDEDIVIPAIILHDVGWKTVPEAQQAMAYGPKATRPELNRQHEVNGVKIAGDILAGVDYALEKTEEILEIISGHDSRKTALSLNDRIVKDADKLWRFTREGFRIDNRRFQFTPTQSLARLYGNLDDWLFTDVARGIALEELGRREQQIANGEPF